MLWWQGEKPPSAGHAHDCKGRGMGKARTVATGVAVIVVGVVFALMVVGFVLSVLV